MSSKHKKRSSSNRGDTMEDEVKHWLKQRPHQDSVEMAFQKSNSSGSTCTITMKQCSDNSKAPSFQLIRDSGDGHLEFSTESDELMEWLIAVIEKQEGCNSAHAMLDLALNSFLKLTDDGADDNDDEREQNDEEEEAYDHMDDDAFMFSEPTPAKKKSASSAPQVDAAAYFTGDGSKAATERLIKDLQALSEQDTTEFGFEVDVVDDNLYHWHARLFNFDGELGADMKRHKVDAVLLDVKFPKDYPFSAPFIRVVRPRFAFHTGHVTIGGSICMEVLTRSGWRPTNDVESILVQIRCEMLAGGARLDASQRDYTEAEAQADLHDETFQTDRNKIK